MIDRYNRKIEYVRISLTDRCNLRCRYCMPESGVTKMNHGDILTLEEVQRTVKVLAKLGIRKVRLTGGEPLLRRGIVELIDKLKAIDGIEKVMLTTNGVLLNKMAEDLIAAGLDGINLSLDTLDADIFNAITRRDSFAEVLSGLHKVIDSALEVKVNCVPIADINGDDVLNIAALARDNYIKVRFIELMPIGCAVDFRGITIDEVKSLIESAYGKLESVPDNMPLNTISKRSALNGPAEYFTINGFKGQIGFIDALGHKFCSSCNRVRLTSDGFLKLCLNSNAGLDIKALLRSGSDNDKLFGDIQSAIYNKPQEHHFGKSIDKVGMYTIGG